MTAGISTMDLYIILIVVLVVIVIFILVLACYFFHRKHAGRQQGKINKLLILHVQCIWEPIL